eukprot:455700_1
MATLPDLQRFENAVLNSDIHEDWIYLSEGNKHLVFEYINPNGILHSLILKINKTINESEGIFASNYISRKWLRIEYLNQLIYPIHLPQSFVLKLVNRIQDQRPQHRKQKHSFQITSNHKNDLIYHASLESNALNLTALKNGCQEHKQSDVIHAIYTFDMKPKWMFLNISPFIDPHNIRKHMCRFSMHQQLKLIQKSIQNVSKYCPLSLLTNDINIISRNLRYLVDAQQTNFKIFSDSKELHSYQFITEYHLKTVASVIIKHNALFKKISMLQRLDRFDIKVVYKMWMELKGRNALNLIETLMHDTKTLDGIIKTLLEAYHKTKFGTEICYCATETKKHKNGVPCNTRYDDEQCNKTIDTFVTKLSDQELAIHVIEYLLSSIFKDCQVLITIDFNHVENHKLTVVDLNTKPMERIENKWLRQDVKIVEHFINLFSK